MGIAPQFRKNPYIANSPLLQFLKNPMTYQLVCCVLSTALSMYFIYKRYVEVHCKICVSSALWLIFEVEKVKLNSWRLNKLLDTGIYQFNTINGLLIHFKKDFYFCFIWLFYYIICDYVVWFIYGVTVKIGYFRSTLCGHDTIFPFGDFRLIGQLSTFRRDKT